MSNSLKSPLAQNEYRTCYNAMWTAGRSAAVDVLHIYD